LEIFYPNIDGSHIKKVVEGKGRRKKKNTEWKKEKGKLKEKKSESGGDASILVMASVAVPS